MRMNTLLGRRFRPEYLSPFSFLSSLEMAAVSIPGPQLPPLNLRSLFTEVVGTLLSPSFPYSLGPLFCYMSCCPVCLGWKKPVFPKLLECKKKMFPWKIPGWNKFGETELIKIKLLSFSGFKCSMFISKEGIKCEAFPRIIRLWHTFVSQWRTLLQMMVWVDIMEHQFYPWAK